MARKPLTAELRRKAKDSLARALRASKEGQTLLRFLPPREEEFPEIASPYARNRKSEFQKRISFLTQHGDFSEDQFSKHMESNPDIANEVGRELERIETARSHGGISDDEAGKRRVILELRADILNRLDRLADEWVAMGEQFLAAAQDADPERLEALAARGAPVNYHDPRNGATALHYVAAQGARPAFRVLFKTGACDFLARDGKGRLAAEVCGLYSRDRAMERLLLLNAIRQAQAKGIPVSQIYRRNATPIPPPALL